MASMLQTEQSSIMKTYNRFPLTIVKGEGSYVYDELGTSYLDFTSGIATCNLGHQPPRVKQALQQQLDQLWHCSNLFHIPIQEKLAQWLTSHSVLDEVFFCNSGTEANEAAIKLVRKATGKDTIVTFRQSFHGRTLGALAATGQPKLQESFGTMLDGFVYLPFNEVEALDQLEDIQPGAVMLELVQGEGGVRPAEQVWVDKLVELCKTLEILLVVDEVQTGIGRTGTLFSYEQYDIEPDVITLAKGLGSGVPIGAMLAKHAVSTAYTPGDHGSTFGGNPLASSAALATVEEVEKTLAHGKRAGEQLVNELLELSSTYDEIQEVRSRGLIVGIQVEDASLYVQKLRDRGILVLTAGPTVIRVLPPLNVKKKEVKRFIEGFAHVLEEVSS